MVLRCCSESTATGVTDVVMDKVRPGLSARAAGTHCRPTRSGHRACHRRTQARCKWFGCWASRRRRRRRSLRPYSRYGEWFRPRIRRRRTCCRRSSRRQHHIRRIHIRRSHRRIHHIPPPYPPPYPPSPFRHHTRLHRHVRLRRHALHLRHHGPKRGRATESARLPPHQTELPCVAWEDLPKYQGVRSKKDSDRKLYCALRKRFLSNKLPERWLCAARERIFGLGRWRYNSPQASNSADSHAARFHGRLGPPLPKVRSPLIPRSSRGPTA